jgi:hypothetical protein
MPRNAVPPDLLSAAEAALRNPDDEAAQLAVEDLWRDERAAHIEDYIKRAVDAAPPLTQSQRDRLATILRGVEPELDDPDAAA